MRLYTSSQMRAMDKYAIDNLNIPSTLLMENAAKAVADTAQRIAKNKKAAIFCGSGNNGGDGIAAARILLIAGFEIKALLVSGKDKMTENSSEMSRRLMEAGGILEDFQPDDPELFAFLSGCGVIIDAMLGTGLNSPLRGAYLKAVDIINGLNAPVVAADIPSGVSADTGEILGNAVMADVTVTFTGKKIGNAVEPGNVYSGEVVVADIGIPAGNAPETCEKVFSMEHEDVKARLPRRKRISHKGDYGKIFIIGGSVGYTGAPFLAARAALRSGAGLIRLGVPASIYPVIASKCVETMPFPLQDDPSGKIDERAIPQVIKVLGESDLCLIGPGLGRSDGVEKLVRAVLCHARVPVVLDADGINAVCGNINVLDRATHPLILTPHEGEYKRLGGILGRDRMKSAAEFSNRHGCVTVLKGHRSITAFPNRRIYINTTGNPGMAKGGSGDVLSGIIAALICQMPLDCAVPSAVWLHGRAGDISARRFGEYSMTPSDLIEALPEAFKEIE
ncbi:MAG: NAD(P)H-hydrate dehydratase [Clostridiales bacterium]|jgi:NAD(P)H-hydrate epimerase|nr:NAD(P)H-hydrate dehydratase [Clostridiales bacterium]